MLSLLKRYLDPLVVAALLLLPFAMFLARGRKAREVNFIDRGVIAITSQLQGVITRTVDGLASGWNSYVALRQVRGENEGLKGENRDLRTRLHGLEEVKAENERLRRLLAYTEGQPFRSIVARVVGVNPDATQLTVRIDQGEAAGVLRGMPVTNAEGVVGHVLRATGGYADVLLIADVNSKIAVRMKTSRTRATAAGAGRVGPLKLENLARGEALEIGDSIITSGTDGIFPPGLMVGIVSNVERKGAGMFQVAELKPAANLNKLEEVFVLSPPTVSTKGESQ